MTAIVLICIKLIQLKLIYKRRNEATVNEYRTKANQPFCRNMMHVCNDLTLEIVSRCSANAKYTSFGLDFYKKCKRIIWCAFSFLSIEKTLKNSHEALQHY